MSSSWPELDGDSRSHALRGNAVRDALRPLGRVRATRSVEDVIPTQSACHTRKTAIMVDRINHLRVHEWSQS
jgi:hypothetical protein